jgi:hypothetical protein
MKKQDILARLENLEIPADSLEQIEREYQAWKPENKEEFREFMKLAATVTGVLKFPEKRSSFRPRTPADIRMQEAFSLLLLGAWKAHQANALRVAEDIEAGHEQAYGPWLVFEE